MKKLNTAIGIAAALLTVSCSVPKNVPYFQDVKDGSELTIASPDKIRMQPDDKIVIIVFSRDYQLTNLFNLPFITQRLGSTAEASTGYSQGISGYCIDKDGCVDFPVLGKIKIAGLTRDEVCEKIKSELIKNNLVMDPVVTVDYMNLHVSVMGEVNKPGRYNIDHDAYTILDAISAAGDLAIYAKREGVKVLRTENGKKKTYEINLCSTENLMSSPVYYLRQNDVVYVEPNQMRARQSTVNGNNVLSTSFWISVASLAATIVTTISLVLSRR